MPTYCATWLDADGAVLLNAPFNAEDDADARDAGVSMIPLLPPGGRARVTDLYVGFWDGARFTTSQDRLIFDSFQPADCEAACGCPWCTPKGNPSDPDGLWPLAI